ncbi:hypothetical protein H6P81_013601 [Aristolochia fimbriata]|uniref:Carboxypeptidase n=1 Tax=Aristolochia fimbriata TaxID=158543 RepID=A0AAV7EF54_ARIFI|nr:hypothetical protein H6P81_013601 [Aristolochia fimbriata]
MDRSFVFLAVLLTLKYSVAESAPDSALVTHLPGFDGTIPSKHHAGYLKLNGKSAGKNLYYYFVESEGDPAKDPVVLWLNGGPGCSSFDGFVYEHGPFNFEARNESAALPKLHLNPYSWSKVSSVIYLDSPAGVGLSYSDNPEDYTTGDFKTASDTHMFLLKWFELYPEFLSNPFFISGESYAGIYVPTLAAEVAKGIDAGVEPIINLKGYLVGNGASGTQFDRNALVPFAHGMGLISDDIFQEVTSICQGDYWDPINENCKNKLSKVYKLLEGLNRYDILEPCYHSPTTLNIVNNYKNELPSSFRRLGETERPLPVRKRMFGRSWPLRAPVKAGRIPTWPELGLGAVGLPCMSDEVATAWLNNEAVRSAIHGEQQNVAGSWDLCTDRITYYHDAGGMIKYHRNLTTKGYRALIFSGDHDMCIPFTGTQAWTRSMGYQVIDEWRPWYVNKQVAGYTQGYANNLTFLTIKGAGHTVPEYKPREALAFYSRWLSGSHV